METENKPKIVVSSCLGFDSCRYDGSKTKSEISKSLLTFVDFVTVCPEKEIGLPTPRDSLRLVEEDSGVELYCTKQDKYYTKEMQDFTKNFISDNADAHGYIFRGSSPSCGLGDVKMYSKDGSLLKTKTSGIFAKGVIENYPACFIESEGRLRNFAIRDKFYIAIFTYNSFKNTNDLAMFHKNNKYLLSSLSPGYYKTMSRYIEDPNEYEKLLIKVLSADVTTAKRMSTLMSLFSHFHNDLLESQKSNMFDNLMLFSNKKLPYQSLITLLWDYVLRYGDEELHEQTIFCPYPKELISVTDSGKAT